MTSHEDDLDLLLSFFLKGRGSFIDYSKQKHGTNSIIVYHNNTIHQLNTKHRQRIPYRDQQKEKAQQQRHTQLEKRANTW